MTRKPLVFPALLLSLSGIGVAPASASDKQVLSTHWDLTPDATVQHPRKHQLALVAPEPTEIALCSFRYLHGRTRETPGSSPDLPPGGKAKVLLQLVTADGRRRLARKRTKIRVEDYGDQGFRWTDLGWADSSGNPRDWDETEYQRNRSFPFHLESGDMVLWTVQFKGMPPVASEQNADPWSQDYLTLIVRCESCGSLETPCPGER